MVSIRFFSHFVHCITAMQPFNYARLHCSYAKCLFTQPETEQCHGFAMYAIQKLAGGLDIR